MPELTGRTSLTEKYKMPTYEFVDIISESDLKNQATFVGWDFDNIWIMGENGPELR